MIPALHITQSLLFFLHGTLDDGFSSAILFQKLGRSFVLFSRSSGRELSKSWPDVLQMGDMWLCTSQDHATLHYRCNTVYDSKLRRPYNSKRCRPPPPSRFLSDPTSRIMGQQNRLVAVAVSNNFVYETEWIANNGRFW